MTTFDADIDFLRRMIEQTETSMVTAGDDYLPLHRERLERFRSIHAQLTALCPERAVFRAAMTWFNDGSPLWYRCPELENLMAYCARAKVANAERERLTAPYLRIGTFRIWPNASDHFWIQNDDDEGMQTTAEKLQNCIREFWAKEF